MLNKIKAGLKAAFAVLKSHPVVIVVLLFILGIFVLPFLFLGFNLLRDKAPAAVKKIVPAATPLDAEAIAAGGAGATPTE